MELNFYVVGVAHELAPVEIRSLFAFTDTKKLDFSARLAELGCSESLVLSTCNRSEVYFLGEHCTAEMGKRAFLSFFDAAESEQFLFSAAGNIALHHLFEVAAGLQSAIVGEDQILGQVKDALEFAEATGTAGKVLSRAFQGAISTAKRIKTDLGISSIPLSSSYIGVKKLCAMAGGLQGKTALVVGTGEMGLLAVKQLLSEGVERIFLCCRNCGVGKDLPEDARITLTAFADRYAHLQEADVIVTATASPHTVFQAERFPALRRPLYIVDMAVPPDVDPDVSALPDVYVLDIDALTQEAAENLARRESLSHDAKRLTAEGIRDFLEWYFHSRVDTAVEFLSLRCGKIAEDTLAVLFHKLSLSPREEKLMSKMMEAGLHRLIREPILRLKELDDEGKQDEYIKVVKELFDVP